ncbi:hypothetical protein Halru_0902 [Halovivax ruber XH-70]|uniref:Uncharacterized protein n=1 Tax=Halovivax ruber (strain DSM 18193 / JCM 13892 / XH-70) TaxID=797302 RepID=L0I9L9_HALRX|nr:hypothetical protein [Halovivax ruber]AGB15523.1 hypothetical protein Halru_0902 [Halovivax ruber XH-70]
MRQYISSIDYTSNPDPNQSIVVEVAIEDIGDGVYLRFKKTVAVLKGSSQEPKEISSKTLEMDNINYDDFEGLVEVLFEFLESKSKPIFSKELTSFDGTFSEKEKVSTSFQSEREQSSNYGFESLGMTIGEFYFDFWPSEGRDWKFRIPPSDKISEGQMENHNNLIELYYTFVDFLKTEYSQEVDWADQDDPTAIQRSAVDKVEFLFERFDQIATPLQNRSRERDPVSMQDEYDVQYLLHGLLKLYFDDVRAEEYFKRHAGKNPRIDFLLEEYGIGIEVKRPSENRTMESIRIALAEDKELYRKDSSCEKLLIFIYDPERRIENAPEFKMSLSEEDSNLETRVTIVQ